MITMTQILATNRRARFDYEILETMEAGIVLTGGEIKSVRNGQVNLKGSFIVIRGGEVWMNHAHIAPYKYAPQEGYEPRRHRKLLLKKTEIEKLAGVVDGKSATIVPLEIYLSHNRAKVKIGLCRGKKKYDKRETIKKRDQDRQIKQLLKK